MLAGKPFAGAGEAGLNFVGDEENAVLAANVLQVLEVIARGNNEPSFAENRFGDDCGDGFGRDGTLEGVFEMVRKSFGGGSFFTAIGIGIGDTVDVAGARLKTGFLGMRFAGERHGEKRAAVKGVLKTDDGGALGVSAGDFDGVFDGFGAGVYQDGFLREVAGGEGVQFFGDSHVAFVGSDGETEVQVLFELLADRGEHSRRAMPGVETPDATGKIEVAIAINVFEDGAFGARGENGRGVGGAARNGGFAAGHKGAG